MWLEVMVNQEPRMVNLDSFRQIFNMDGKLVLEFQDGDYLFTQESYERIHKFIFKSKTTQTITIG